MEGKQKGGGLRRLEIYGRANDARRCENGCACRSVVFLLAVELTYLLLHFIVYENSIPNIPVGECAPLYWLTGLQACGWRSIWVTYPAG